MNMTGASAITFLLRNWGMAVALPLRLDRVILRLEQMRVCTKLTTSQADSKIPEN
jgi:hypothetical protein